MEMTFVQAVEIILDRICTAVETNPDNNYHVNYWTLDDGRHLVGVTAGKDHFTFSDDWSGELLQEELKRIEECIIVGAGGNRSL